MSSVQPPSGSRQDEINIDGNRQEQEYDPRYGISKEEFEWRHSQEEKARHHVSEALQKVQVEAEKVQCHFYDDPDALEVWNEYMDDVRCAASRNLVYTLSSHALNSGLYEQLMRRKKTCPKTFVGMLSGECDKLKRATRNKMPRISVVASIAAAFAAGFAVRTSKDTK
ncbi:hypothetical protein QOZ80_7AG0582220 [Eleusine coracana subsp. coracana]|nr:hypothetical protein QOZ80_7AG0582220 [Eleusine coracana subsp. coracana]